VGYVRGDVDLGRDAELVHRFQAGDVGAFDELYCEYFDRLRRYCERRLHDPALAEDVAQEAFTRAYRALPRLRGERRFYPWLTVIASRLCIDTVRRDGRSVPVAEPPVASVQHVDGPEDAAIGAVDLDHLAAALQEIRPRYREVLRLRESEGLSAREIAAYEGTTVGSVEVALHRARSALRQRFEALAGAGRDALAGLPLLPALLRRLRSAGWRLTAQPDAPAGALAGALAATALVLGAAAGPAAPPASAHPAGSADRVATAPQPDFSPHPLGDVPEAAAAAAGGAPRPAAAADAGGGQPPPPPVVIMSAEEAREESADSPVIADVERAFVAADPDEAIAEASERTDDYLDQLGGQP